MAVPWNSSITPNALNAQHSVPNGLLPHQVQTCPLNRIGRRGRGWVAAVRGQDAVPMT